MPLIHPYSQLKTKGAALPNRVEGFLRAPLARSRNLCLIKEHSYTVTVVGARDLSRFSTRRICSREQRKKQLDWLGRNTDNTISQSHSLFACSREKNGQVENGLEELIPTHTVNIPHDRLSCLARISKACI